MKETAIDRVLGELQKIKDFVALLDLAEKQNCDLIDILKKMEDEQMDILHEFEMDKFYRTEGHRKALRLKKIRQERRVIKDTLELWSPLKEFAKSHRRIKAELREMIEDIEDITKEQKKRIYTPRIDTESVVAGKHFEPKKMDIPGRIRATKNAKKAI